MARETPSIVTLKALLVRARYVVGTFLDTAGNVIFFIPSKICEEIARPDPPHRKVPLHELLTARYVVVTTSTTINSLVFYVPRTIYRSLPTLRETGREVPLNELFTLKYLFTTIEAYLPESVVKVLEQIHRRIPRPSNPLPNIMSEDLLWPVHLVSSLGSSTINILIYVPRKLQERLTQPSEVAPALNEICASMLMHSMAIHAGARNEKDLDDSDTVVGDTITLDDANKTLALSEGQEARDFANGMTSDLRMQLAEDFVEGLRFNLDEYDAMGALETLREALRDRAFGKNTPGRVRAMEVFIRRFGLAPGRKR